MFLKLCIKVFWSHREDLHTRIWNLEAEQKLWASWDKLGPNLVVVLIIQVQGEGWATALLGVTVLFWLLTFKCQGRLDLSESSTRISPFGPSRT